MFKWFRDLHKRMRHNRAEDIRRRVKVQVLLNDAKLFFAGLKTTEESLAYRDFCYRRLDAMTDDEILEVK